MWIRGPDKQLGKSTEALYDGTLQKAEEALEGRQRLLVKG
jgi:hypothetical protein